MGEQYKKNVKRMFSLALLIVMLLTFGQTVSAADNLENADAFDAIGIDTSTPDGVDLNSTENPYGTDRVNILPVFELFEGSVSLTEDKQKAKLYGHESTMLVNQETFYGIQGVSKDSGTELTPGGYYASSAAAGDFTGSAQDDMVVTVAAGNFDTSSGDDITAKGAYAGIYLYVTNPETGETSTVKTLLKTTSYIGNIGRYDEEDFGEAPYQLQNYLQVETGDFDGDGIDEIAVYIPQGGGGTATSNSRVEIYKLSYTSESGNKPESNYLDMAKWEKAWTYAFYEGFYVSNMVSLLAGDFNRDGTDDLAMSWGVYYSSEYKNNSKAVILYGDNKNEMLQKDKWFDLNYGNSQIVRAAFTYGDVNGDGTDEVVLGGQLEDDINNGIMSTRVINMYTYNGDQDSFIPYSSDNFNLVEYEDDEGDMKKLGDGKYYSSPAMVANIAAVRFGGKGTDYYIYLDSVIYAYGNNGLQIYDMLEDNQDGGALSTFYNNSRLNGVTFPSPVQQEMARYYVEYGVLSGDFTGNSKENLHVSQYFLLQEFKTSWEETVWQKFSKRYWWFWTSTWWQKSTVTHTANHTINGDFNVYAFYAVTNGDGTITGMNTRKLYDGGTKLDKYYCLVNTDSDTSFMEYTGNHYVVYTDPEVLAVIASAPYFEDVGNMAGGDDHVGNSETSYSSSTGSEQGSTTSNTISAGAYFGIDADVTVFGVKVASFEMETEYSHGWTWETEKSSTMEQTITYGTSAGEDAVAFYSIPMEVYDYILYTPITDSNNQVIGYEEQTMTVNIPHTAAVTVLSLDKYESIAADYPELPRISGTVLTHEIGDPSTYPTSDNGYRDAVVYNGNWAAVGYGNGYISQEIAMGTGTTKSYSQTNSFSFKIGGGVGVVKAGVTVGTEWGKGSATTTTEGSTFSATIVNMPAGAEDFGYYYAWKLFTYDYSDGRTSFPVVNFLVTDVTAPPTVPTNFDWDIETTTDASIDLTWSYSGNASAFAIYRQYNFSGSTGMVKIAEVAASDSEDYDEETNSRLYRYTVDGLGAYQDYKFQIQVIGTSQPTTSAPGVMLGTRTKTDKGYPHLALSTTDLLVYPDAVGTVTLGVSYDGLDSNSAYIATLYQWQKLTNGQWTNVASTSDFTTATMRIRNAGISSAGNYRCMVNVIYYDVVRGAEYYITAYSDTVNVSYSKRTSRVRDNISATYSSNVSKPTLSVNIENTHGDSATAPAGTVTFFIQGVDYVKSYDASLVPVTGETYSVATLTSGNISALTDGVFEITAYYGGNRIFRSSESEPIMYKSGSSDGYWLEVSERAIYGETITPTLHLVTGFGANAEKTPVVNEVTYAVSDVAGWVSGSNITAKAVGSYTITASVYGSGVTSKQITVSPYQLTLVAPTFTHTANTAIVGHPSVSKLTAYNTANMEEILSLPNGDTLESLGLYIRAINSAFKEGTILRHDPDSGDDPNEDPTYGDPTYGDLWFYSPGKYILVATPGSSANSAKLSNYEITSAAGTYTITAATFSVHPTALLLNGQVRGTVEVTSPQGFVMGTEYQNGTQVTFKATPYEGYEVKAWYIANSEAGLTIATPHQVAGGNYMGTYLNWLMNSEPLYVAVEFRVAQRSLNFGANNEAFGRVNCDSSPYLNSGAIFSTGTSYTFTADPSVGYQFVSWVVSGAQSYTDTTNETISVTGGTTSITLRAVFERKRYVLTLDGDLQANYYDDTDSNSNTPDEKIVVLTGAAIPGDKSVVVEPKSGYSVENWINVVCTEQTYTFTITDHTTVQAATYYNGYEVSLTTTQAANGDSTVTINQDITESVTGGAEIVFEAKPTYGTRFAGWKINGNDEYLAASTDALTLSANGRKLTIKAIGRDYEIEAVFENNDVYNLTLTKAAYGSMIVTVTNPTYGTVDNPIYNYGSGGVSTILAVYKGDTVNLTTTPANGFRVFYWKEDAKTTQTDAANWTISSIQSNKSIEVDFSATGFYTVTYGIVGSGSFSSAKIDGVSFDSGSQSMGAGTTISFVANPEINNMLHHWTVNGATLLNNYGKPIVDMDYSFVLSQNSDVKAVFTSLATNTISLAGDNVTMKVTDVSPEDYAIGNAQDGYTAVREGAYAKLTITPDTGYYIYSATVTGNEGGFGKLTKGDYIANAQTGESWTGEIYAVTDNITVTVDARPIHQVTFTPDDSKLELELSSIKPYNYTETATYTTGTGTYYVREGSKINLSITPNSGYYINSATVTGNSEIFNDLDMGAYVASAQTGEIWTGVIDSVTDNITVIVDAKPIYQVTFTPDDSKLELELSSIKPYNYTETAAYTIGTGTYYVREGSKINLSITPNSGYYINSATVTGNNEIFNDLDMGAYVASAQTGEIWTGVIDSVTDNITVIVDAKLIHQVTFTPDDSKLELELSSIKPYNYTETATYTTGTGTYYVREGSKINLSITPNSGYYINSATLIDNDGEFDELIKGTYAPNIQTGESWTGKVDFVTENITVNIDTKPIHVMSFTPNDSTLTITLSNIQPYDYTDTATYTGTGTYYVRDGSKIDFSITPVSGYALADVINGSNTIIRESSFTYDAYNVNAATGETWAYTIPSADTGAAFVVDSNPIHNITITPSQSTVTLTLNGPRIWYNESTGFSENITRKARDGAIATFTIEPQMNNSINNVTVSGADGYILTKDPEVPYARTGETWTVTVNGVVEDVNFTVETVYNPRDLSFSGGVVPDNTPKISNEISRNVKEIDGAAVVEIDEKEAASTLKFVEQNNSSSMVVSVETGRDVSIVTTKLPLVTVNEIANSTIADLVLKSGIAAITFSNDALYEIAGQATGEDITISVEKINNKMLTEEQAAIVGDNPVYDMNLTSGGQQISSFGGKNVTVALPYVLKDGEDAKSVTVYYIADDGTVTKVENAVFDAERGVVEFDTDHFSYYMVAQDKLLTWANPFTDVSYGDWYYENVYYAYQNGLMNGTGVDRFSPQTSISRAMVVTILYRLEGEPEAPLAIFSDVVAGMYYYDAVAWATSADIVTGYGELFGPNDSITREQLAAMLYRYGNFKGYDTSAAGDMTQFTDAGDASGWAVDAIKWVVGSKLMSGKDRGILDLNGNATRAEVAAMIERWIENIVK